MGLKTITAGTNPLSTDIDQLRQAFSNVADVGALQMVSAQNTPSAPTGTTSGTGLLNGTYYWITVLITGWQQSDGSYYVTGFAPSVDSAQATIANGKGSLTGIATGGAGTIGRAIYRTLASGAVGTEKFSLVIWDNTTTTILDNTADGNLGTGMPGSSSTPAAYGTAIPATVPTANTTGSTFTCPNYDAQLASITKYPASHVYNSTTQSIPNSTDTPLAFDSTRFDNDTMHSNTTNNTRLTCKTAGVYVIFANAVFDASTAGMRNLILRLNGVTRLSAQQTIAYNSLYPALSVSTTWKLNIGDYVEVIAYQNSGGATLVGNNPSEFTMVKVG